jgi:uncharacterized protein (DUF983 family)
MKDVSKLQAILGAKCPRCRQGNIFEYSNWKLSRFTATHEQCPVCKLRYEVEPGFFIGAMYISYAMSVALAFISGAAVYVLGNDPALWVYIVVVTSLVVFLLPLMFRYSRVLFLYMFSGVKYNKQAARQS